MAGLVPAISLRDGLREKLLRLHPRQPVRGRVVYVGVTSNLVRRVYEHRRGLADSHTKQYRIHQLIHFEGYPSVHDALQREKNIKHWPRAWKARLIAQSNPEWRDLFDEISSSNSVIAGLVLVISIMGAMLT